MDNPYQLLPDLTSEEYEALRESIRADGVKVAIEYDEAGIVLDGHHRLRACRELGITEWPRVVRRGMSENQKRDHVLALNLARRHLSREQRRELVARLRELGMSTRTIANKLGVNRETVMSDIRQVVGIQPPDTVTGSDGKHYPAQRITDYDFEREQILEANRQGASISVPPAKPAPHVSHNSGENEWYTPSVYIEAARRTMGSIDLDPASSHLANKTVKANVYYTAEDNGLSQEWYGNVWMNPPYAQPLIAKFSDMVADKYDCGDIEQGCVLVNNATETAAFQRMLESCDCVCFLRTRVKFVDMNGVASGAPLQGQAILYFGKNTEAFCKAFSDMGRILHAR